MTSGLARALWAENAGLAERALRHPFVVALGAGTLPRATFAVYVAQDACFLEGFARAYAAAAAKSPDLGGLVSFTRLQSGVIDELRLHASYAAKWGVDLGRVSPLAETRMYTDFLADAARREVGFICAAMTPCMRLYAHLGQELARTADRTQNPYDEWIATYSSNAFEDLAAQLEQLLDRYATPTEPVRAAYSRALELEVAFFGGHYAEEVLA